MNKIAVILDGILVDKLFFPEGQIKVQKYEISMNHAFLSNLSTPEKRLKQTKLEKYHNYRMCVLPVGLYE
jgi:hypothetical protein